MSETYRALPGLPIVLKIANQWEQGMSATQMMAGRRWKRRCNNPNSGKQTVDKSKWKRKEIKVWRERERWADGDRDIVWQRTTESLCSRGSTASLRGRDVLSRSLSFTPYASSPFFIPRPFRFNVVICAFLLFNPDIVDLRYVRSIHIHTHSKVFSL